MSLQVQAISSAYDGLRGSAPWARTGRQYAHVMERHIRMVTDAIMCKLLVRQQLC
jgi:hypothetical protein